MLTLGLVSCLLADNTMSHDVSSDSDLRVLDQYKLITHSKLLGFVPLPHAYYQKLHGATGHGIGTTTSKLFRNLLQDISILEKALQMMGMLPSQHILVFQNLMAMMQYG